LRPGCGMVTEGRVWEALAEVVAGDVPGRQSDDDIVVFKSNGIAAWDVAAGAAVLAIARERDIGREL
ncbi:MAG: ornithine cyclodeaminase family protein, partial [Gaiellales bacterium]